MSRQSTPKATARTTASRAPGALKSTLMRWLGVPITLQSGDFWADYAGAQGAAGECVTISSALKISTVWACVRLISETIASLPLKLYERKPDGSRREAREHPLYTLLNDTPNADTTAITFWECVIASMLLWGTAFIEKRRIGSRLVALDFLRPERMGVRRLTDGSLEYRYHEQNGTTRQIAEADLVRIPAFSLDGVLGLSPVQYGANVIGNAQAQDRTAGATFANGMRFEGVFEFDHVLKQDQREAMQERLDRYRGAIRAGQSPLLELGIRYKPVTINPDDAQMLESRQFSVEEIARWYRIPPSMIGHGTAVSNWGTGLEQQMMGFLTFTLRPWLRRIVQAVKKDLLTPAERSRYYAEHVVEDLLRADSAGRAALYASAGQNGWMDRNEMRQRENLEPREGGDELTVQSNLITLRQLAQPPQPPEAPPAPNPPAGQGDPNDPTPPQQSPPS